MIGFLRDLRLVPIVLVATIALFALKTAGLVLDGGYLFEDGVSSGTEDGDVTGAIGAGERPGAPAKKPAPAHKPSWAQEMFNYPDVTGSVTAPSPPSPPQEESAPAKPEAVAKPETAGKPETAAKPEAAAKKPSEGTPVPLDSERVASPAERAILESLQKRRTELDARARELDMRESLLQAAEKRLEGRIAELKDLQARVDAAVGQKDEAEQARFKNLVNMYDNMKAKDAAKIFDRLDLKVLVAVATQINPRRMSDILAQMSPDAAERLTVELAARGPKQPPDAAPPQLINLPKIEGKPNPN
jgi:flagellar motility protein MotE (MotC chaperone)